MIIPQYRAIYGVCSFCDRFTAIHHSVELPRSKKILAQYCLSCFDKCYI